MVTEEQLKKIDIFQWSDLEGEFKDCGLLLGNGFSLNFADSFKYPSLFEKFLVKCPDKYQKILLSFGTNNFEKILQKLTYAIFVNNLYGIETKEIKDTVTILKEGLIKTIRDIHPKSESIFWDELILISDKMVLFDTIFTLNYDLFLYHILMILRDKWVDNEKKRNSPKYKSMWRYGDCLWGDFDSNFKSFVEYQDREQKYRYVYYLHGALFIFKLEQSVDELKRIKGDRTIQLIDIIGDVIKNGNMPIFICEGDSTEKLKQIKQSNYLQFSYNRLKFTKLRKFVIYGCSLSEQDEHILTAIDKSGYKLAISIHVNDKSVEKLKATKDYFSNKFTKAEVVFFDSVGLFKFNDKGKAE